jgi:NADH dehydrogenase FAD-containing subunit
MCWSTRSSKAPATPRCSLPVTSPAGPTGRTPSSGVYAVRAGPPLAVNLLAAHRGQPLKPHHPPVNTLNLLSCGAGHAIASWGPLHAEGAWAWRWKDRIDRAFMAKYTLGPA